jgi:hypothetical protein
MENNQTKEEIGRWRKHCKSCEVNKNYQKAAARSQGETNLHIKFGIGSTIDGRRGARTEFTLQNAGAILKETKAINAQAQHMKNRREKEEKRDSNEQNVTKERSIRMPARSLEKHKSNRGIHNTVWKTEHIQNRREQQEKKRKLQTTIVKRKRQQNIEV